MYGRWTMVAGGGREGTYSVALAGVWGGVGGLGQSWMRLGPSRVMGGLIKWRHTRPLGRGSGQAEEILHDSLSKSHGPPVLTHRWKTTLRTSCGLSRVSSSGEAGMWHMGSYSAFKAVWGLAGPGRGWGQGTPVPAQVTEAGWALA